MKRPPSGGLWLWPDGLRSEIRLVRRVVVAGDRIDQHLPSFVATAPAIELHPLAGLKILVVLEEVADPVEPVLRHVVYMLDVGVARIDLVDRHGEDLLVVAGLV